MISEAIIIIQGAEKRTPEMDLWAMEEVVAWFIEEGLPEYESIIIKNRVDGYLVSTQEDHPSIVRDLPASRITSVPLSSYAAFTFGM